MFAFYLFSAALIGFALLLLLYPLLQNSPNAQLQKQASQLQTELRQLEKLHQDGTLDQQAMTVAKGKLAEKWLHAAGVPLTRDRTAFKLAISFVALLPLLVMLVYKLIGTPSGLSFEPRPLAMQTSETQNASGNADSANTANRPSAESQQLAQADGATANSASGPDLNKAAEGLRARLESNPKDGEGWQLLGRTYLELANYAEAQKALQQAVALLPADADLYAQLGEAIGLGARPNAPGPEAEAAIDQALKLNAKHPNALWLKGVFNVQAGKLEEADRAWSSLFGQLDPSDPSASRLQEAINRVREQLKRPLLGSAETQPAAVVETQTALSEAAESSSTAIASGPSEPPQQSETPAPSASAITLVVSISAALAEKLAPNDVLYVYARAENGPPMPLAIHRSPAAALKSGVVEVRLDDNSAMMPSMKLSMFPKVVLGARVSKSGLANAQPGDYQVLSQGLLQPVTGSISLKIEQVL